MINETVKILCENNTSSLETVHSSAMESAQKKLDFDSHDESYEDHLKFIDNKFCFPEDDIGITSSPLSRRLQLQSPRKIKRHMHTRFQEWKDDEEFVHPMLPPSPVSQNYLDHEKGPQPGLLDKPPLTYSPPYKRVRALRLFDTPITPKTIIEKSNPGLLSGVNLPEDFPRPIPSSFKPTVEKPVANTNPFTPDILLRFRKRTRSLRNLNSLHSSPNSVNSSMQSIEDSQTAMQQGSMLEDDEDEVRQPRKRIAINESNITRYHKEFHEVALIGAGEFGSVHKCINRLDGCIYAIKRSIQPIAGSADEQRALNEVYAHAVLGSHPHVVRYYSAWAEENHMIIQNEFCGGGSLADQLKKLREANEKPPGLPEKELRRILLHISRGLHFIHQAGLVHLDIKPGNIFIAHEARVVPVSALNSSGELSMEEEEAVAEPEREENVYKIGDLGHVTSSDMPKVEEGDCRYLPRELLQDDFSHLTKADIFSLGLTIYEAAGAGPLPKNGDLWHAYRDGNLPELPYLSSSLNELIKSMVHSNPAERPSASQIASHPLLSDAPPRGLTAREVELQREVNVQRLKSEILERQLQDANRLLKMSQEKAKTLHETKRILKAGHEEFKSSLDSNCNLRLPVDRAKSRLVGCRTKRSMSATNF
ncbi:wee1-like protein kinase 2 [Neocloeon triangulifer]|uniref:wee1-like protein kinase 2 n=1 Tax=Neocloeon triangulifer TaxID=2078957 RepID=UPI00286F5B77|nr:wee1-like protein kinase 2 [Neocloeon triangulifer]